MILFYSENIDEQNALLEEEEYQHCIKVLRHKLNDTICVTDGKGTFAKASIINISKRSAQLKIISKEQKQQKSSQVILAIAPPKSKARWEFLIEKTVEIGVDIIQPFYSQHSERVKLNSERAAKIIRSAALQSKRILHPKIMESINFSELLIQYSEQKFNKYIAKYDAHHAHLISTQPKFDTSLIVIGPEGDFSEEEYQSALQNNFLAVNLSDNRLRTETAALCALSILTNLHDVN